MPSTIKSIQAGFLWLAVVALSWMAILGTKSHHPYLFSADHIYLPSLLSDATTEPFSLREWALQPAPSFFPDMVLFLPVYFLSLQSIVGSVFAGVVLNWLMQSVLFFSLLKQWCLVSKRYMALVLALPLVLTVWDFEEKLFLRGWLLSHHGSLGTVVLGFWYLWAKKSLTMPSILWKEASFILIVLCFLLLSDLLTLPLLVIPFVVSTSLVMLFQRFKVKPEILFSFSEFRHRLIFWGFVSVSIAIYLTLVHVKKWLFPNSPQFQPFQMIRHDWKSGQISVSDFGNAWIEGWKHSLLGFSMGEWVLFALAVYSGIWLWRRGSSFKTSWDSVSHSIPHRFFLFYCVFAFFTVVSAHGMISQLYFHDLASEKRYLSPLFLLAGFLVSWAGSYLWQRLGNRIQNLAFGGGLALSAILVCGKLVLQQESLSLSYIPSELVCLQTHKDELPSPRGITGYWSAKTVTYFSEREFTLQAFRGTTPYVWVDRKKAFDWEKPFHFVLFGNHSLIQPEEIQTLLGEPKKKIHCKEFGSGNHEIWIYPEGKRIPVF